MLVPSAPLLPVTQMAFVVVEVSSVKTILVRVQIYQPFFHAGEVVCHSPPVVVADEEDR